MAALTMAALLFVYTRISIRVAKLHAQRRRESDGGQVDWGREDRRRRGQLEKVDEKSVLKEAFFGNSDTGAGSPSDAKAKLDSLPEPKASVEEDSAKKLKEYKKSQQKPTET